MTESYHFVGIGGAGMSALARLLLHAGARVSGSDARPSGATAELAALGAKVAIGHDSRNVPPEAKVVVSDAIHAGNPEVGAAKVRGQAILRRSELMGRMMQRFDGIAVSGTHGKTTTTAMLARILIEAGLDPTVVVGGHVAELGGNARAGQGRLFVAEACEAYDALLDTHPMVAVIINIEADHLDHHGTLEHIVETFEQFAANIVPGGVLVANADDARAAVVASRHAGRAVSFGLANGDWRAQDISRAGTASRFHVTRGGKRVATVELPLPGEHYVLDALAAIAAAAEAGVEPPVAAAALATFQPVGRRFERLGECGGAVVYDDYAHHPTEVRKTLEAARAAFGGRLFAVFQPHLYSRTRDHLAEFVAAFDAADDVTITPIFGAREGPIPGVDAAQIVDGICARAPAKPCRLAEPNAVPALLAPELRPHDVVFVMGAGDVRAVGEALVEGGFRIQDPGSSSEPPPPAPPPRCGGGENKAEDTALGPGC